MKLSLSVLAAALASANAFTASPLATNVAFSRSSVVLEASKNKAKIASRSKWAAARGYGDSAVADADAAAAGLMTNDDGLEYVRLTNANGDTSDIYLFGGVVTSYVTGGQEYIAVRPDAKMDGSKPISGGLSHCWPQFGPGEIQVRYVPAYSSLYLNKTLSPPHAEARDTHLLFSSPLSNTDSPEMSTGL